MLWALVTKAKGHIVQVLDVENNYIVAETNKPENTGLLEALVAAHNSGESPYIGETVLN